MSELELEVRAVAPELLAAVRGLFGRASSSCFCRFWHFQGTKNEWLDRCANAPEANAHELERAVSAGDPSARALVALERATGDAIGWMKLTARSEVPKLRALPVYRALDLGDERTTFSIGCLLVDPAQRRRGVARALVSAAPPFVARWGGRAIEAYPRRASAPLYDEEAWQGHEALFRELGFDVVHDVAPYPVYRKVLDATR